MSWRSAHVPATGDDGIVVSTATIVDSGVQVPQVRLHTSPTAMPSAMKSQPGNVIMSAEHPLRAKPWRSMSSLKNWWRSQQSSPAHVLGGVVVTVVSVADDVVTVVSDAVVSVVSVALVTLVCVALVRVTLVTVRVVAHSLTKSPQQSPMSPQL